MKSFRSILFTDEKILFTDESVDKISPKSNNALSNETKISGKKILMHQHFPKLVMVWVKICETEQTTLVFVERQVKINAKC